MTMRWGVIFLCLVGCANLSKQSELLTLSQTDTEIVGFEGQETENIYDPLNLLKRGEAYRVKKEYPEAVEEYQRFLELYPFHRMAPFAQYALGISYDAQILSTDRNPTPIEQAILAFNNVRTRYPESLYAQQASEKIKALTEQHAEYQFRIGHFYYKKGAYAAAIARFEKALAIGAIGTMTEKTLYYIGLSHDKMGNGLQAAEAFQRLRETYPSGSYAWKIPKR